MAEARARMRPAPWARLERYRSWRVPEETGHYLIRRGGAEILDAVVERTGVDGLVAAIEIGQRARALKRAGLPIQRLGVEAWVQVFDLFTDGLLPRECLGIVAARMAADGLDAAEAARAEGIALVPRERWSAELQALTMEGYLGERVDTPEKRLRFLAGKAMAQLKGRAPAAEVARYLKDRLEATR